MPHLKLEPKLREWKKAAMEELKTMSDVLKDLDKEVKRAATEAAKIAQRIYEQAAKHHRQLEKAMEDYAEAHAHDYEDDEDEEPDLDVFDDGHPVFDASAGLYEVSSADDADSSVEAISDGFDLLTSALDTMREQIKNIKC